MNIILIKKIYQNIISAIYIYISLFNNTVNLKYKANGIEAYRLIKSAIIFGSSPILLAFGSLIITTAAQIIMIVPIISCFVTVLHSTIVAMIVIGP